MPLREFKCRECGKVFEFLLLRKSDSDELKCSSCGSRELDTMLSVFGVAGAVEKPFTSSSSGCSSCAKGTCSTCGH